MLSAVRTRRSSGRRDQVFVDGSFSNANDKGESCLGGIGVWIPSRRIALSVQVSVKTSMEAETLALLAGAMVAKHLRLNQPVIYSDCKSAITTGARHLGLERRQSLGKTLRRLVQLSGEHSAYRHTYSVLSALRGTLAWRPREENREADLASCIGSRHGAMAIELLGSKNFSHALNDILSRTPSRASRRASSAPQHHRRGTKVTELGPQDPTTYAEFRREARSIIQSVLADVA